MRFAFNAARLADFSYFRLYLGSGGVEEWRSGGVGVETLWFLASVQKWRSGGQLFLPIPHSPYLPLSLTGESGQ